MKTHCRHLEMTSYRLEDLHTGDLTNMGIVCHECHREIDLDMFVDLKIERALEKFKQELLSDNLE